MEPLIHKNNNDCFMEVTNSVMNMALKYFSIVTDVIGLLYGGVSTKFSFCFPSVVDWIKSRDLSYLAVPKYIASGSHDHGGTKFRFMVMERFGEDIEKKFTAAGRKFSLATVCYLALQLVSRSSACCSLNMCISSYHNITCIFAMAS